MISLKIPINKCWLQSKNKIILQIIYEIFHENSQIIVSRPCTWWYRTRTPPPLWAKKHGNGFNRSFHLRPLRTSSTMHAVDYFAIEVMLCIPLSFNTSFYVSFFISEFNTFIKYSYMKKDSELKFNCVIYVLRLLGSPFIQVWS